MKRLVVSLISFLMAALYFVNAAGQAAAVGSAPVAENLELKTYTNVSVGGMLSAFDPDGGALQFVITTEPVKGCIKLQEDGSFIYTPKENKKGRDYFGYKALDEEGNYSQEATVIIQILKQKKTVFYADMKGSSDEYAAVVLSETGLYTGKQICGVYCFEPDAYVTRGEFLSMCMALTGKEPVIWMTIESRPGRSPTRPQQGCEVSTMALKPKRVRSFPARKRSPADRLLLCWITHWSWKMLVIYSAMSIWIRHRPRPARI